ncbi:response regulator [Marinicrinis sediminis]|uniref:Response regulator n=1 Tax=Marinicrinis sediminis TaxID=1652465 RepID=A0ABW5R732_9BACL
MRMIIVDDEDFIRLGMEKILSKMDMDIDIIGSYSNGMDALNHLSKLNEQEIDVLITDIKMPIMDGLKLVEHAGEQMKGLSMIILSGFSEFEYARKALRYGVVDYLLKPVDKQQLYQLLRQIYDRKARSPQVERELSTSGDKAHSEHYVIDQIKSILDQEYDQPFELEKLAETIGMSSSYISRLFKNETGATITDYLIQLRIAKAKQFLTDHPNLRNYEIAQFVGYGDAVYFNKLFKKMVGMTPKEYKEKSR